MDLIINNHIIRTPIINILKQLKSELTNNKLSDMADKHSYIKITCPHHNNGKEKHPSCGVYTGEGDLDLEPGFTHCFSCGFKGDLAHLVGECFETDDDFGREWLVARFGNTLAIEQDREILKPIETKKSKVYLDESTLNSFQNYHPYMTKRKLTPEVINKFKIKYDPQSRCILFPVWDENGHLITITKRSVDIKNFYLDYNIEKPVYLLNFFKDSKELYICESQINALTLVGYGLPSVALFGTGSSNQYEILNKFNFNHYILALDPDEAGKRGIIRFVSHISKNVFIDVLEIPKGKDVNDLTKEEFYALQKMDIYDWLEKNAK